MWEKLIKRGENIGLKLTAAERELILESVMCHDGDYEEYKRGQAHIVTLCSGSWYGSVVVPSRYLRYMRLSPLFPFGLFPAPLSLLCFPPVD